MKVIRGDLVKLALDGRFELIIDGCNRQCVTGSGIARMIKQTFPEAYKAGEATPKGSRDKPRSLSTATVERSGRKISIVSGCAHSTARSRCPGGL
jgi:O-acetyl-ADP-ribose deacetylase (regulator of RNase III)